MKKMRLGWLLLPVVSAVLLCAALSGRGGVAAEELSPFERVLDVIPGERLKENFLSVRKTVPEPKKTEKDPEIYIRNDTSFQINAPELYKRGVSVHAGTGVQVIIVHTHGTEAYTPEGGDVYTPSDEYRTTDENYNVLRVGEELKSTLEKAGIKTVHVKTLCDYPAYSGAYDRSFDAIEQALSEHPEAQIVIDLHRDAVMTASGEYYRAAAEINGRQAAQLEFVCGTDGGGLAHPNWRDNLSFQLSLQVMLENEYPGLMRPLNLRAARFNQHFRTGSMLVEFGTNANTLAEALYSAQLFGKVLAAALLN